MKRASSWVVPFPLLVLLAGCGAATGSIKTSADKEFLFSEVEKVKAGMSEARVVELLGKPSVFGVDEHGRHYLDYDRTRQSLTAGMAAVPGAGGATVSISRRGFEVRVYLKDGKVEGIAHTVYEEVNKNK